MDSAKYIDILESSFDEMNSILPNGWILQWDNDLKHKSKDSLCFYIKNKIKLMKWPAYSPDLNPIENIWENIKHYLGSRTFSSISSLKRRLNINGIKFIMNLQKIDRFSKAKNKYLNLFRRSFNRILIYFLFQKNILSNKFRGHFFCRGLKFCVDYCNNVKLFGFRFEFLQPDSERWVFVISSIIW